MLDRFDRFTSAISSIHRFVQKIERHEMEKYGLKGAAAQYLLAMARYPQGITAAALCDVCDRDKAAVSRILADMEEKGLILRTGPGDTQYRALLTLTDKGREAARFVDQKAATAVALAGRDLDDTERKIFYNALEKIANSLKTLSAKGIPDNE